MMEVRQFTVTDRAFAAVDGVLNTLLGSNKHASVCLRKSPAQDHPEAELSTSEKKSIAAMMRVNHSGEVCAQALYQGQAMTARSQAIRDKLEQSALEEEDHLAWCKQRLQELDDRTSHLDPAWFLGSLLIGIGAGIIGDEINLGFLAETERQVVKHLQKHIDKVPTKDKKTHAILEQMKKDEQHHATVAIEQGAKELPKVVKRLMAKSSKVMTNITKYI